jgi:hypothetical protein
MLTVPVIDITTNILRAIMTADMSRAEQEKQGIRLTSKPNESTNIVFKEVHVLFS